MAGRAGGVERPGVAEDLHAVDRAGDGRRGHRDGRRDDDVDAVEELVDGGLIFLERGERGFVFGDRRARRREEAGERLRERSGIGAPVGSEAAPDLEATIGSKTRAIVFASIGKVDARDTSRRTLRSRRDDARDRDRRRRYLRAIGNARRCDDACLPDGKCRRSDLRVFDRARQEADVIEGRARAEQALRAEPAEGRLEADASAERRGNAHAAAGVAAGGGRAQMRDDGRRGSAARSAGDARLIDRDCASSRRTD